MYFKVLLLKNCSILRKSGTFYMPTSCMESIQYKSLYCSKLTSVNVMGLFITLSIITGPVVWPNDIRLRYLATNTLGGFGNKQDDHVEQNFTANW